MMHPMDFSGFLPPKARSILHFGCRDGQTAEHFRRIQPDCRYMAVTEEAHAAALLPSVDAVLSGAPDSTELSALGVESVDCILYEGSTVSALTAGILRHHGECLAPNGQMVFFLENPCYFGNLCALLSGKNLPSSAGMPLEEIRSLLKEAGLFPVAATPLYSKTDEEERQRPETAALFRSMSAWQEARGISPMDVWAVGYLLRAVREKPRKAVSIFSFLGETVVTPRVRLREPHAFLMTEPGIFCREAVAPASIVPVHEAERRILIRQRLHYESREAALREIKAVMRWGYLTVHELDDDVSLWQKSYEASDWLDFRGSHACQVSTEALAEKLRLYNPHVKVFRNELRELPPRREESETPFVTVFFGALNREEDWREIMPALNEAAKHYGQKLRFRVIADKAFFDALKTKHKEFIGDDRYYNGKFVPYDVYTKVLHASDISLLPLRDTEFNRMKSDLKFIESAGHGAAVLASPTVYSGTIRDGFTGFLYRSPREFAERLKLLVEDRALRLGLAEAAYRYVKRERLLSQHYGERLAWYEELLARKEELDRELEQRIAETRNS